MTHKNAIINGNFDLWQRGTSNFSAAGYTADRWKLESLGTGGSPAATVSQESFSPGQCEVPNNPVYYLRWNQTTLASSTAPELQQRIEFVRKFAQQKITLSFFARADQGTDREIKVSFRQNFGTGGSPSANADSSSETFSLNSFWKKYSMTLTLGGLTGKTFGTNSNDYLALRIQLPLNTTFTVDIAQVQVEYGPEATEFADRPLALEIELAQRFYEKTYNLNITPGTSPQLPGENLGTCRAVSSTTTESVTVRFITRKRGVPTVKTYNAEDGTVDEISYNTNATVATAIIDRAGETGFGVYVTTASGLTAENAVMVRGHWTADAEI